MTTKGMSDQIADLKKAFAEAGIELKTALRKGLTNAALIVEGDYKVRLTLGGQVATGLLRASATHRLIDTGKYFAAQVGSNTEYAAEVEFGGPPRDVPLQDILNWVIRKGIAGRSGKSGRRVKSDMANERAIAFLIQRSIKEKGTMPHPALIPALVSNREAIFKAIETPLRAKLSERSVK